MTPAPADAQPVRMWLVKVSVVASGRQRKDQWTEWAVLANSAKGAGAILRSEKPTMFEVRGATITRVREWGKTVMVWSGRE